MNRRTHKIDPEAKPALLFSGGNELSSIALGEELLEQSVPLLVVGLGQESLLRDVPGVLACCQLSWPPHAGDYRELLAWLESLDAAIPWPVPAFANEDGGLRYLLEGRESLANFLHIPGSPHLRLGGLDKAELFQFLQNQGLSNLLAPTRIFDSAKEAPLAFDEWGDDVVFKPALKPLSMDLPSRFCKVVTREPHETKTEVLNRLEANWHLSARWLAQPRLVPDANGEGLCWATRHQDGTSHAVSAHERIKQPALGGTGCWVTLTNDTKLIQAGKELLQALEFRGIAELPFLMDHLGRWRLLEINPRPWLQVSLAHRGGVPLVSACYADFAGQPAPVFEARFTPLSWVSIERLLLVLAKPQGSSFWRTLRQIGSMLNLSQLHFPPYDSTLPGIRRRWIGRMIGRLRRWRG